MGKSCRAIWKDCGPHFYKKLKNIKMKKNQLFLNVLIFFHIWQKDLNFSGIVLIGRSYEEILERNKKSPRWGSTPELQELEAKLFFEVERPRYRAEAEKYEYDFLKIII